jgi:hypothetical protein
MPNGTQHVHVEALKCPHCGAELTAAAGHVICQYCGSSLVVTAPPAPPEPGGQPQPETVHRGMRLRPYTQGDPGGTGLEVFRLLVPAGWEARGGVTWNLQNVRMPAVAVFQCWNPGGLEGLEILPNLNFVGGGGLGGLLSGGQSFGAPVLQPMAAPVAMQQLVIPRYRGGMAGLTIRRTEPAPELAQAVQAEGAPAMVQRQVDAARARLVYQVGENGIEEELWAVVEVLYLPVQTLFGGQEVVWYITHILGFRAAEGRLDALADLFGTMVRSIKVNPAWMAAYEQTITGLAQAQIRHIQQIGQIGRNYAQMGAQMREENLQSWYGKHEVWDRLARERSESIRGVETYYDPYKGSEVELSSQYNQAWANGRGEYILTDDPNFDPNADTDTPLAWERLQPV